MRTAEEWEGAGAGARDVPEPSLRWVETLPPEMSAVGRCRLDVGRALDGAGIAPAVIADALVVLGEITANAVRHAGTEFVVTVTVAAGVLRFEVVDFDTRPPALLGLDAESTSGRGLHLVAGLAANWGWNTAETAEGITGKLVWAEMDTAEGGRA